MSDLLARQRITAATVLDALSLVTYRAPDTTEQPEPPCTWQRLCGETFCRFPRYMRDGKPNGLVANVLIELGYPLDLLKQLDIEYEISEVLHPGVKIGRARNHALRRIDLAGLKLLSFLQERQKIGRAWKQLHVDAIRPRYLTIRYLDARRRPWLY